MSDKSKPSHIERVVYVRADISNGGTVRYGDWSDKPTDWREHTKQLTLIDYTIGSDYSGTLVEISNARVMKKQFPWLVEVYGAHGTAGLAYLGKRENQSDALIETIDALTEYPIVSDNDHSDLEHEKEHEAWESDGRADFKRALVKYFDALYAPDEHDADLMPDDAIDELWYDCTDRLMGGESFRNEQGGQIYFPIDDVIKKFERSWPGMDKPCPYRNRPSISSSLTALAEMATIHDDQPEQGA